MDEIQNSDKLFMEMARLVAKAHGLVRGSAAFDQFLILSRAFLDQKDSGSRDFVAALGRCDALGAFNAFVDFIRAIGFGHVVDLVARANALATADEIKAMAKELVVKAGIPVGGADAFFAEVARLVAAKTNLSEGDLQQFESLWRAYVSDKDMDDVDYDDMLDAASTAVSDALKVFILVFDDHDLLILMSRMDTLAPEEAIKAAEGYVAALPVSVHDL